MTRAAAVCVAFLLLAGCASFGYQKATIAVPRATLALAYADVKADYAVARYVVTFLCAEPPSLGPTECAMARGIDARAREADTKVRALLLSSDDTPDLGAVLGVIRSLTPILMGLTGGRLPMMP